MSSEPQPTFKTILNTVKGNACIPYRSTKYTLIKESWSNWNLIDWIQFKDIRLKQIRRSISNILFLTPAVNSKKVLIKRRSSICSVYMLLLINNIADFQENCCSLKYGFLLRRDKLTPKTKRTSQTSSTAKQLENRTAHTKTSIHQGKVWDCLFQQQNADEYFWGCTQNWVLSYSKMLINISRLQTQVTFVAYSMLKLSAFSASLLNEFSALRARKSRENKCWKKFNF